MEDIRDLVYDEDSVTDFLLSISDDIIIQNIQEQIKNPKQENENYFKFILDKLLSMELVLTDDPILKQKVISFRDDLCDNIRQQLEQRFGLTIDLSNQNNPTKIILKIYDFFVIRHDIILENAIREYIKREYASLVLLYTKELKLNKKDLTFINNKNTLDKEKIAILMNLHSIINSFNVASTDDMLDLLIDDTSEVLNDLINKLYEDGCIILNPEFLEIITNDLKNNSNTLLMSLRLSILEKEL